ncbi:AAA domain-containing protein [Pseudomonas brassicacearum]
MLSHEPQEFWSEASGNQDALIDCYQFMTRQDNPSAAGTVKDQRGEGGRGEARQEVMLVVGDPGCGATALACQLDHRLRTAGLKVLTMDKISSLEPGSFKANFDAAIRVPPSVSNTSSGSTSVGLSALQRAVLEARNYDCFIVHDMEIYASDETAQAANAAAIIQLMRANRAARFLFLGAADIMEWLTLELRAARVDCRTVQLEPMPANSRFGHFVTSVALRVLQPCPPGRIDALDVDTIHTESGGKVGLAIKVLIHQIMDNGSPVDAGADQNSAIWVCDEDEFSVLDGGQADRSITASFDASVNLQVLQPTGSIGGQTGSIRAQADSVRRSSGWERESSSQRQPSATQSWNHSGSTETDFRHCDPAVENESFSSWVARLGMGQGHSAGLSLGDALVMHCGKGGADPDLQWANLELLQPLSLSDRLYVSGKFALQIPGDESNCAQSSGNLSSDIIPYSKALNYCPECFKVDVAAGLAPAMRVEWRQPWLCVCQRHNAPVLLERMATSTFTLLDKGWRAFAEYAGSPASRLATQFPLQHASSMHAKADNDRLLALAARMQGWFFELTADTTPSAKAAEFLMSYWLQDPNVSGAQGYARTYFFYRLTKPQAATKKQYGETSTELKPDSSRPRDAAVAYWMLGIGFGVIDTSEAEFIRDTTRPYSIPFPTTRDEASSVSGMAYGKGQQHAYLEYAKLMLDDADYRAVEWALKYEGALYRGRNKGRAKS